MPEFRPFRGLRYDSDLLDGELGAVTAPPYDVIDESERVALERSHELNCVRLILPRDEIDEGDRYERAAQTLSEWQQRGVLELDDQPRFYGYRMRFFDSAGRERSTLGVLGALELPHGGPGSGGVLPHERTLPKAKSDRLSLLRATRSNLDPIWLLSLASGLTDSISTSHELAGCSDSEGVRHELFAIDDAADIAQISTMVGESDAVLADGHHRFEVACKYRRELEEEDQHVGGASSILALVVELAEEQLRIEPIHRALRLPAGTSLREKLADDFEMLDPSPADPASIERLTARSAALGGIVLVDEHGATRLVAGDRARAAVDASWPATVAGTDAALVETVVATRLEGAQWEYRHDALATAALVTAGAADAALLLSPVSVETTRTASLAGDRMPQKTTFFSPKPRTGLVFRSFDA